MIGESWVTTTFEKLEDWGQRNSFWPFPFGTAWCAIEFMSTVSSHYDVSRFGAEVVRFSPRQSDVLLVAGTINDKMAPELKQKVVRDRKRHRARASEGPAVDRVASGDADAA